MKILIFIPTFNDRVLIASLVKSILALGVEFYTLVIDDGSDPALETDGLSGPRERYFRCPYNVGLGVTTNIALDYAQKEKFDIFLRIEITSSSFTSDLLSTSNLLISAVMSLSVSRTKTSLANIASFNFELILSFKDSKLFKLRERVFHNSFIVSF